MSNQLKNIIEALLMVSDVPIGVSKIQGLFEKGAEPEARQIKEAIQELKSDCETRSIEVKKIGSGYRLQTRAHYAEWIRKLQAGRPPRLSRAQLETLAIIAYRQPVTRGDIEEIRGVAVSVEIMQRLNERDWIKQLGVRDVPGRPALFGTTPEFLAYFNLESLSDLPELLEQREFADIARDMDINLPPEVLSALSQTEAEKQSDMFGEVDEGNSNQQSRDDNVGEDDINQSSGSEVADGESESVDVTPPVSTETEQSESYVIEADGQKSG